MPAHELAEMVALERLIDEYHALLSVRTLCHVDAHGRRFPVYAIALGSGKPDAPAAGFFGGVHGLERIGTQVLLAFLKTLLVRLQWDHSLHAQLAELRLVFMPIINPAGMWSSTRCNGRGVDLMRNAPVDSAEHVPPLLGGQRISPRLPWFRGVEGAAMEIEGEAVCHVVREELLSRRFSVALDCHSGFGLRDRIWFPYAHSKTPIPHLAEIGALRELFWQTYPNHNYVFEPQSKQYLANGDLWDHLYLQSLQRAAAGSDPDDAPVFLPLTLELGSWSWVKKNPLQLFTRPGYFNPLPIHRLQRALRRHLIWLEFLMLAARSYHRWLPRGHKQAEERRRAMALWYGAPA